MEISFVLVKRIILGGLSLIQIGFAQTQLFENCGKNAWIARINGTDEEKIFGREFMGKDWNRARKSGTEGVLCFGGLIPGLYEYRQFAISDDLANCDDSGFVLMTNQGVAKVNKDHALEIAKLLDQISWDDLVAQNHWVD